MDRSWLFHSISLLHLHPTSVEFKATQARVPRQSLQAVSFQVFLKSSIRVTQSFICLDELNLLLGNWSNAVMQHTTWRNYAPHRPEIYMSWVGIGLQPNIVEQWCMVLFCTSSLKRGIAPCKILRSHKDSLTSGICFQISYLAMEVILLDANSLLICIFIVVV